MKKTILLLCALALLLVGCGKKDPTVDYGSSERYTREDMDAAIGLIRAEFDTWTGCELHALRYAGDGCCTEENLRWLNDHPHEGPDFTECIEFLSDFHSPKSSARAGAFNTDYEYTDWNWWLARPDGFRDAPGRGRRVLDPVRRVSESHDVLSVHGKLR